MHRVPISCQQFFRPFTRFSYSLHPSRYQLHNHATHHIQRKGFISLTKSINYRRNPLQPQSCLYDTRQRRGSGLGPFAPSPSPPPTSGVAITENDGSGVVFSIRAHPSAASIAVPHRPVNNGDMPGFAIETENLTKQYPYGFLHLKKKTSLEGLTLQVETGGVFGLLGPNGAGKSTTIKLLMNLIFPTSGTARLLGKPVDDVGMHRDIGYLPEQPYFYDYLTAAEVLDYFAKFFHFTAADRKERVQRMLKKVGLETAGKIQLRKYSKGMLQRVGLAQAILHDPQLVILDEPMSGLDPVGRREVRDIILELKQAGKTILFSTHILSDAEMLCDRVGVLVGGTLRGVGAPGEIVGIAAQKMEILFALGVPPGAAGNGAPLLGKATRTGGGYRLEISEDDLYPVLAQLRDAGAKILSVAQVKPSLEEYFMHLVAADRAQAAAVEVSGK